MLFMVIERFKNRNARAVYTPPENGVECFPKGSGTLTVGLKLTLIAASN